MLILLLLLLSIFKHRPQKWHFQLELSSILNVWRLKFGLFFKEDTWQIIAEMEKLKSKKKGKLRIYWSLFIA